MTTTTAHTTQNPAGLHDPVPFGYSHTAVVPSDAELVLIAGQYGSDETGRVIADDFGSQVDRAFDNLAVAVEAHGMELRHIAQLRTYVVDHDMERTATIGAAVGRRWGDNPPTQTILGVTALATPDLLFEVEAVAVHRGA